MLGIRATPKEDLQASAAELVYGAPISVPGEFFGRAPDSHGRTDRSVQMKDSLRDFYPKPTSFHGGRVLQDQTSIQNAKFVFIRRGPQMGPLQRPYDGPYRVIEPGAKAFKIDMGGRQ